MIIKSRNLKPNRSSKLKSDCLKLRKNLGKDIYNQYIRLYYFQK